VDPRPHVPLAGVAIMLVRMSRFTLRDFREADRQAFVAYQIDPRYRQLYRFGDDHRRAHELFERFLSWQRHTRVERLARWFGAKIIARHDGPEWMAARGWSEVDWELRRDAWTSSPRREQLTSVLDRRSSYPTDGVPRALDRGPRDFSDDVRDAALRRVWDAKR
jgi:hypothetical protein